PDAFPVQTPEISGVTPFYIDLDINVNFSIRKLPGVSKDVDRTNPAPLRTAKKLAEVPADFSVTRSGHAGSVVA
ncbi:MAG TPA: hypothetical protein VNG12_20380, partial [Acidimicrobiales bacterium]|nr:hypothetical protein [Acidimicrobiales bacterium]